MAEAVRHSIETGEHLAVQAGTGTGKSLAYLVPAVRHAVTTGSTVVVATATIALQRQLIDRDLPRLVAALRPLLDREPVFAILKGRRNYLCLHRQKGGVADDPQDGLFEPAAVFDSTEGPASPLGRQVKRLHDWAGQTTSGDRDELVPGVPEAAWRQVSVSAQECIGAQRCPFGSRCFAEKARDAAGRADIVVTNHALLAIDATSEIDVLPDHDVRDDLLAAAYPNSAAARCEFRVRPWWCAGLGGPCTERAGIHESQIGGLDRTDGTQWGIATSVRGGHASPSAWATARARSRWA